MGCQTDLTLEDIAGMQEGIQTLSYELRSKVLDTGLSQQSFNVNEEKTKFYTGLPNFLVLMQVFQLCESYISTTSLSVLGKFEQLILVLIRLQLNLSLNLCLSHGPIKYNHSLLISTANEIR